MKINKIHDNEISLSGIADQSLSNGEGLRIVIFSQGCTHHCKKCFNPETWDFNKGKIFNIEELFNSFKNNTYLNGVTFSGGDPVSQADKFYKLGKLIKDNTKFSIWMFTGFTWEQLLTLAKTNESVKRLLSVVDFIMDGKFDYKKMVSDLNEKEQKKYKYRGSYNQRCIDVKKSLKQKRIVIYNCK